MHVDIENLWLNWINKRPCSFTKFDKNSNTPNYNQVDIHGP